MKVNGPAAAVSDHLEVLPSMESFQFVDPAPAAASAGRRRRERELLQTKVEALERLYATHKVGRGDSSAGERAAVEFDGDILLKMVDDLERNMKLSRSPESERGRWYGEYSARREVKLQEELGVKGAHKRRKMKVIAAMLEESWEEMVAKSSKEGASAIRRRVQQLQEDEEDLDGEPKNSQQSISDDLPKSPMNAPAKTSSSPNQPIPKPSSKNPNSTKRTTRPRNVLPSSHTLPDSYLRNENTNKKQPMRPNKADDDDVPPLRSTNSSCSSDPATQTMETSSDSKDGGEGSNAVKMNSETQSSIEHCRSSIFHIEISGEEPKTKLEERGSAEEPQGTARSRKKWVAAERPAATRGGSDKLLKDVAKQFKRLFGKKKKKKKKKTSTSSDSGGDEDVELTERTSSSPEDLKKSISEYSIPARVGFLERVRCRKCSRSLPASPANVRWRRNDDDGEDDEMEGFSRGSCSPFFFSFNGRGSGSRQKCQGAASAPQH